MQLKISMPIVSLSIRDLLQTKIILITMREIFIASIIDKEIAFYVNRFEIIFAPQYSLF